MPAHLSDLDTARFGVVTARSDIGNLDDVAASYAFCRSHDAGLLIARCPTTATDAVQQLEEDGARLMDCLVCYRRDNRRQPHVELPENRAGIREARREDAGGIARVAATAFERYQGHYHSDSRLPRADSTEAYADWTRRLCANEAEDAVVFVASKGDAIDAFSVTRLNSSREAEILLAGVAPHAQGSGLMFAMAPWVHRWSVERGARYIIFWTKITNLPIQRAMVRHHYQIVSSAFTLHRWYESIGLPRG